MSKRRRLRKNSQRSDPPDTDTSLSQSLTCVRVVCLNGPDTLLLPHVAARLNAFLDGSPKWTLVRACAANYLGLVQRVLGRLSLEPASSGLRRPEVRRWQFEISMVKAAAVGNLDVVKLLVTHFKKYRVTKRFVNEAAKHGHMEILEWVKTQCQFKEWLAEAFYFTLQEGHFELAKWFQANTLAPSLNVLDKCAVVVAKQGDLEMLKWVCGLSAGFEDGAQMKVNPWRVVNEAVDIGHLEMLKWIFEQPNRTAPILGGDDITHGEIVVKIHASEAVLCGHFDVLEWLIPKHRELCCFVEADAIAAEAGRLDTLRWICDNNLVDEPSWAAFERATDNDHLHVLKWMLEQEQRYDYGRSIDKAARNGHLQVVKWLHANIPIRSTKLAMKGAAEKGHLDVVKFLYEIGSELCDFGAMAEAIRTGNLEVAKWMHTNMKFSNVAPIERLWMTARAGDFATIQWVHTQRLEGWTSDVMNTAAGYGHLDIVKWLHANRTEGCTTDAMDDAASNNHFDVVKWLHANRTEGCTTDAMDKAASKNHFDVVKWLHANRTEGCTTNAMDGAASNNHFNVVTWLHENRTEGCTRRAMTYAAYQGHLEMVQWLNENRSEGCSVATFSSLKRFIKMGNFEVAWYLHQARSDFDLGTALEQCSDKRRWEFTEWAYIHHREEIESTVAIH